MNIFYLHDDPFVSAQAMTNKHVCKMVIETAQLLSTAHHVLDNEQAQNKDKLYKITHKNHPSAVWARQSKGNYEWLYSHFIALALEYAERFHKQHKTYKDLRDVLQPFPKNLPDGRKLQPPQAMPDIHKDSNSVQAYRRYYLNEKIKNDQDLERFVTTLWDN